jgi:ATP-binding protein involved in chromosome partitioning
MFSKKGVTKEAVLQALSTVQEPELHKDLVSLNMIRELKINGDLVKFQIMLTTPACPLRSRIENEARAAVMSVPGVKTVEISMDASVLGWQIRGCEQPIHNAVAIGSGKVSQENDGSCNTAVVLAKVAQKWGCWMLISMVQMYPG